MRGRGVDVMDVKGHIEGLCAIFFHHNLPLTRPLSSTVKGPPLRHRL